MQPLEYLLKFLVEQVGTEAAFQAVYEAVNQNTSSEQADQFNFSFSRCNRYAKTTRTSYSNDVAGNPEKLGIVTS